MRSATWPNGSRTGSGDRPDEAGDEAAAEPVETRVARGRDPHGGDVVVLGGRPPATPDRSPAMTTLPSARRRAEEFADAVDSVLAQDGTGGRGPTPEAASLLDVVVALRSVPAPSAPRPEFTADLRERLLVEAASVLAPTQPVRVAASAEAVRVPVRRTRRPGRLVAAASAFVVVGGTAGVATAAQRALPGEALYPVKRALEGAELRLSTTEAGRGRDLLDQATNRLEELESLLPATTSSGAAAASVAARLPSTVQAFTSQAVEGSGLLLHAFETRATPPLSRRSARSRPPASRACRGSRLSHPTRSARSSRGLQQRCSPSTRAPRRCARRVATAIPWWRSRRTSASRRRTRSSAGARGRAAEQVAPT